MDWVVFRMVRYSEKNYKDGNTRWQMDLSGMGMVQKREEGNYKDGKRDGKQTTL